MASTLSLRVNKLFGAYVTMNATQQRLADEGRFAEVDHLTPLSSELSSEICNIQDRSANADLLAARIMLELIMGHVSLPEKADDWSLEERVFPLPMLEAVADATTGVVRDQARRILATIGVEIEPEAPDPLLSLVTEYRTQLDTFNASPLTMSQAEDVALEAETWRPSYAVLMGGDVPNATTLPGALTALRELHREFVDCGGADEMAIAVLPAVVALFDRDSALNMRQRAAAAEGGAS